MTKEELKLHIDNRYSVCSKRNQGLSYGSFYDGYMDCYSDLEEKLANADYQLEGRDNEIAELRKENENLASIAEHQQSSNMKRYFEIEELKKENAELKAKIEKMKCCANCKHSRTEYEHCKTNKHEKWEIKEND